MSLGCQAVMEHRPGLWGMLREAEITSSVILFGFNLIKWRQECTFFQHFFYNWGHHIINTGVAVFTIPDICPCVKRYQDLVAKYIHCPVTHHNSCPRGLISIQSWHYMSLISPPQSPEAAHQCSSSKPTPPPAQVQCPSLSVFQIWTFGPRPLVPLSLCHGQWPECRGGHRAQILDKF